MEFSKGELIVMEELWNGDCLDANGEIQAIDLAKKLEKEQDINKNSTYTFLGRLLEKGAISRRYPKYTLKPIVGREEALSKQRMEAIDGLFQGSFINICRTFLGKRNLNEEEIEELKKIIENFDDED